MFLKLEVASFQLEKPFATTVSETLQQHRYGSRQHLDSHHSAGKARY